MCSKAYTVKVQYSRHLIHWHFNNLTGFRFHREFWSYSQSDMSSDSVGPKSDVSRSVQSINQIQIMFNLVLQVIVSN